jgi:hypothetical protein
LALLVSLAALRADGLPKGLNILSLWLARWASSFCATTQAEQHNTNCFFDFNSKQ